MPTSPAIALRRRSALAGNLPRSDPEPEEDRRAAAEMEKGPGGWFVRTGCYLCHPVVVFGVRSPTPIGPDLSTAADDTERRFSRPIDVFVRNPVGTMRAVFTRQFMLSPAQKDEAIQQLRAAFAQYESVRAAAVRRRVRAADVLETEPVPRAVDHGQRVPEQLSALQPKPYPHPTNGLRPRWWLHRRPGLSGRK